MLFTTFPLVFDAGTHCWSPIVVANLVQNAAQQYLIIIFNGIEAPAGLRERLLPSCFYQWSLLPSSLFSPRFAVHVKIICIIRYYFRRSRERKTCHMQRDLFCCFLHTYVHTYVQLTVSCNLQQKTEEDKTNMCKPLLSSLLRSVRGPRPDSKAPPESQHPSPRSRLPTPDYFIPNSPSRPAISFKVAQQDFEPVVMTWPKSS